jgi:hypothetical protein
MAMEWFAFGHMGICFPKNSHLRKYGSNIEKLGNELPLKVTESLVAGDYATPS